MMNKVLMKKVFFIFFGFFFFLIAVAAVVPFVVDVDQYRGVIEKKASESINGKLELGRLKLSLWGILRIHVEKIVLKDQKKQKLFQGDEVKVTLPWSSVFIGKPKLVLELQKPDIFLKRDSQGTLNWLSLIKKEEKSSEKENEDESFLKENAKDAQDKDFKKIEIPKIAQNAHLDFLIHNAILNFTDDSTKFETQWKPLNFEIKDFSLKNSSDILMKAEVLVEQEDLKLDGILELKSKLKPVLEKNRIQGFDFAGSFDASTLAIRKGEIFEKQKGVPLAINWDLEIRPESIQINKTHFQFHTLTSDLNGVLGSEVRIQAKGHIPDLSVWKKFIPEEKLKKLQGLLQFQFTAEGPKDLLVASGDLNLQINEAVHDILKAPFSANLNGRFHSQLPSDFEFKWNLGRNDLTGKLNFLGFDAPQIKLEMNSQNLVLEEIVKIEKNDSENKIPKNQEISKTEDNLKKDAPPSEDYDQMVSEIFKNEVLKKIKFGFVGKFGLLKTQDLLAENTEVKASFADLKFVLENFQSKVFDGKISFKAKADFNHQKPRYSFQGSAQKLRIQKMVQAQLKAFQNTIFGDLDFSVQGQGQSLNPPIATEFLDMNGSFTAHNAQFATLDVMNMAQEAIEKSAKKIMDSVPGIKKKLKNSKSYEIPYEKISADFFMKNGVFKMPNFFAKSNPQKAIDVQGLTEVDLKTKKLKAKWWFIDKWNLTGAMDWSVEALGQKIPSILSEDKKTVKFPITIACDLEKPCYSSDEIPSYLIQVALKNSSQKVFKDQKKNVEKKLKKELKKGLKSLREKFFQ